MNITSKAGAFLKSPNETDLPSIFESEKFGAAVPNGSMVLGVRAIVVSPRWGGFRGIKPHGDGGLYRGRDSGAGCSFLCRKRRNFLGTGGVGNYTGNRPSAVLVV